MSTIQQNLRNVHQQISNLELNFGKSVTLIAVSKTHDIDKIKQAIAAGQQIFGENYLQEALPKIAQLPKDIEWHFIGPIQSNKTKEIAENFSWVQTLDRLKIAKRLNEQRPQTLPPLNVLIQVNISHEATKSGIMPEELDQFAKEISLLPQLKLRGLMAIPAPSDDPEQQRKVFKQMSLLFQTLQQSYDIDTLSMGMTNDYLLAIEEGSTMVRVGTAIFGKRGN